MEVEKNNGSQDWICDSCVHKWICDLWTTAFNGGLVIKHCKEHMTKEESNKALKTLFGEG